MLRRKSLIFLACVSTLIASACATAQPEPEPTADNPPNVLIFLADDQGWGDLSLHGNKDLRTPNIDSLARDGVSFDRFYVCAVCAPTRAEFLTGRYHPRTGVHGVSQGAERMNLDEKTIADAFKAAGYATGCFGKWHNGMQYPYHPRARGFDSFVGYCSGHWGDYFDAELERDGVYFKSKGYITDAITSEAIQFIETNAKEDKPFFCYLPLPTPHSPMQVPDAYWQRHKDKELLMDHPDKREGSLVHTRAALAMVENIDDNVGRVLKKLDELKLTENTIVVYFSDNGPNGDRWNGGMKGWKGSINEGGVRSAMLMRWPGTIDAADHVMTIVGAIDLFPTLADLSGVEIVGEMPIDGLNLKPLLFGFHNEDQAKQFQSRVVFSHQNGRVSARFNQLMLDSKGRIIDYRNDPGQTQDVTGQFPTESARLWDAIEGWADLITASNKRKPRPFVVGHKDWPYTELPARDATSKGGIKRSSPHPNCSYFFNWVSTDDAIVWDAQVLTAGKYEAFVYYACPAEDVGATIELSFGDAKVAGKVAEVNDPPLEGEKENRIFMRESYTKDFKPMSLGVIELPAGRGEMLLRATDIPGEQAIEFRRLMFKRVD